MRNHTKEPWRVGDAGFSVFGPKRDDGSMPELVAHGPRKANVERIVACVNALAEIENPAAIDGVLFAALKVVNGLPNSTALDTINAIEALRDALEKLAFPPGGG